MEDFSNLTNIDAPTANQDLGVGRNDVTPGDGTGTELEVPWLPDLYYALYAVMDAAGIMPDGSGEGVVSSQFLDGLLGVIGLDAVGGNLTASTGAFAVSASGAGGGSVHVINSAEAVGSSSALYFGVSTALASGSIYSQILSVITQATPSALKGELQFFTNRGDSNQVALTLTDAGAVNIGAGGILQHNGTTVLDASRNLTNIGTVGCGAITSTGNIVSQVSGSGTFGGSLWSNNSAEAVGSSSALYFGVSTVLASGSIYSQIKAAITQATPSVLKGELQFFTNRGDSNQVALTLTDAGAVNIASGGVLQSNGVSVLGWEATGNTAVYLRKVSMQINLGQALSTTSIASLTNFLALSSFAWASGVTNRYYDISLDSVNIYVSSYGAADCTSVSTVAANTIIDVYYYASA